MSYAQWRPTIWELVDCPQGANLVSCKWVFKVKRLPNGDIDKFKAASGERFYSTLRHWLRRDLCASGAHGRPTRTARDSSSGRSRGAWDGYRHSISSQRARGRDLHGTTATPTKHGQQGMSTLEGSIRPKVIRKGVESTNWQGAQEAWVHSDSNRRVNIGQQGPQHHYRVVCGWCRAIRTSAASTTVNQGSPEQGLQHEGPWPNQHHPWDASTTRPSKAYAMDRSIALHKGYTERVSVTDCRPVATPADGYEQLRPGAPGDDPSNEPFADIGLYQRALGCLNWLERVSRPDLAFVVHKLSQFCHNRIANTGKECYGYSDT